MANLSNWFATILFLGIFCQTSVAIESESPCSGFRTQTQGGWGANPNGNNPAVYLFNNFSGAFPNGIEIGCNKKLKLTSANAVKYFLPSGGPPSQLPNGTTTNPSSYGNVLAGQLVALTISVGFDNYDPNFGSSAINLKDLIISSGTFQGQTVQDVLDEANSYIGGCGSSYSASQLNNVLSSINENYVDGTHNDGFLLCPVVIDLNANVHHVKCHGASTGYINLTPSGGNGGYAYQWSNGSSSQDIYNLAAGTYSVTVTSSGSTATATYTVSEPLPLDLNETISQPTCSGSLGSISVNATGGNGGHYYQWNNGTWGNTLNNLSAGNYSVTVWDYKGCSYSETYTIAQSVPVSASISKNNGNCFNGNLGSATVTTSGGASVLWSNGSTSATISNLSAGTYSVTATNSSGCTATASTTIAVEGCCNVTSAGAIGSNQSQCGAYDPAPLTSLSPGSGGIGNLEYVWMKKDANGTISIVPGANAETYDPGTISETTKFKRGVRRSGCSQYKESNWVTLKVLSSPTVSLSVTNGDCSNGNLGSITATGSSGVAYLWSNGSTSQTISNLASGSYSVTVTNTTTGCSASAEEMVENQTAITVSETIENVTCNGGSDGSIELEVSGGAPSSCQIPTYTPVSTCMACTQTASGNQSFNITSGQKICVLDGNSFTGNINMSGGELVICGDASPQNFSTTGGKIVVHGSLQVNVINLHQTTEIYNYGSITSTTNITGFGLLENYGSISVNGDLNNNSNGTFTNYGSVAVSSNMNNGSVGVNNGTISVSGTFQNNNQGTFTNNCTMQVSYNFLNNALFTNNGNIACSATSHFNGPSNYYMGNGAIHTTINTHVNSTVQGPANGCSKMVVSGNSTINGSGILSGYLDYCDPTGIETNTGTMGANVSTDCSCPASGQSGGSYSFTWSNGETSSSIGNLGAGQYSVTISDGGNCTQVQTYTVSQPSAIDVVLTITNGTCSNGNSGSVTANATGGTGGLNYQWSNGSIGNSISNLAEGSYMLTITDENGCSDTAVANVATTPCCNVTDAGNISSGTSNCGPFDPGTITSVALPSGGLGGIEYQWMMSDTNVAYSNGSPYWTEITGATNDTYSPGTLSTTTYFVRLAKRSNCNSFESSNISGLVVYPEPSISFSGTNTTCSYSTDGSATITGAGGTMPYTYYWENGANTTALGNLSIGSYGITLTDYNGCQASGTASVNGPSPIVNTYYVYNMFPFQSFAGEIEVTGTSGGTPPYTYVWGSGDTTNALSGLEEGWYFITTYDGAGCMATDSIEVTKLQIYGKGIGDSEVEEAKEPEASINVFPNPNTTGLIKIQVNHFQKDDLVSLVLTDVNGRKVQQCGYALPSTDCTIEMPMENIAPGTYFMQFNSTSFNTVVPISIMR